MGERLQRKIMCEFTTGFYSVSLTVTNPVGSDAERKDDYIAVAPIPIANFDYSGFPAVTFTDTSTGGPTSWLWDFGDGDTSTLQNPTHFYSYGGTYEVTLTATNDCGSDSVSRVVEHEA